MFDDDFQIHHENHIITVLQGDDVIGHVVPMIDGYVGFAFDEKFGVFRMMRAEHSYRQSVAKLQDKWVQAHREVAA